MKILHLCLSNFYIDGYNYQENVLSRINKEDGHDVRILASTETFVDNLHMGYVEPSEYETEYGVPIKRLPYVKVGTHFTTIKFRKYPHVYEEIAAFAPDVIMSHSLGYWSVLDVIRYKKDYPEVKLYADTHADFFNSGTNWLSLHILHGVFYRYLVRKALPYLEKYFFLGANCKKFLKEVYGVPDDLMEFYPLGGILPTEAEYADRRSRRRMELGLTEKDILLVHSGKLDALKRTEDLLHAFSSVPDGRLKLAIIGSIPEDMKPVLEPLMAADQRVIYLGWRPSVELMEYLCACDFYCQPGSASATMQNAVCCGCGIMLQDTPPYADYFDWGNVVWVKTREDIENCIRGISDGSLNLEALQNNSWRFAREQLDYHKLAARLYQ